MRILQAVVAFLLLPFSAVLANWDSFGDELVFFYWAYKIQNAANLPPNQVIGSQCGGGSRKCDFATFVKFVTEPNFPDVFKGRRPTFNPGENEATRIQNAVKNQRQEPRFRLNNLLYPRSASIDTAFQRAVQNIAAAARLTSPGVSLNDLKTARTFASRILGQRRNAQITYKVLRQAIIEAIGTEDNLKYIKYGPEKWFDWDATIDAITNAEAAQELTPTDAQSLKQSLQSLSRSIPSRQAASSATKSHFAIMQRLSAGVTEMKNWADSTLRQNPQAVKVDPSNVPAACLTEQLRRSSLHGNLLFEWMMSSEV